VGAGHLLGSWDQTVRNDYLKAVHAALLQRIGVEQTRAFWAAHPLARSGRILSERELALHIRDEGAKSPLDWAMSVVNALEPFLLERGIDATSFAETTRRFANHGSWIQSRHLMKWLAPILAPMLRLGDPHRLILRGARLITTRMSPSADFRNARWRSPEPAESRRAGTIWLSYPGLMEGKIPAWDFLVFPGLDMMVAPTIFGLPPFDSLTVICDARAVEGVPWDASCRRSGDRFAIDGITHGRCVKLGRFLADSGYDIGEIRVEDVEVVAIDRDYRCPWRARTVLSQGSAYGAPGYLARLTWTAGAVARKSLIASAQAELDESIGTTQATLDGLQEDYLRAVSGPPEPG
jgi:hypothetical protein